MSANKVHSAFSLQIAMQDKPYAFLQQMVVVNI